MFRFCAHSLGITLFGKLTKLFESQSNDRWQIELCFYITLGDGQLQVCENNDSILIEEKRQILGKNAPLSHASQFEKTSKSESFYQG